MRRKSASRGLDDAGIPAARARFVFTDATLAPCTLLSGLGLEPFAALVERQLSEMPAERSSAIRAAIQKCDWGVLRNQLAVSCKYLEDAYARPSGRAVFERLAPRAPAARFFVFQGNDDLHTPLRYAQELDAWNEQLGHLDLTFRYYDGAHVGAPPNVQREVSDLLVRLTAPRASEPRALSVGK